MLAGFFNWRVCWLAFVLRWGVEKEEMEARSMSDWSSPMSEAQSPAGVLTVANTLWMVGWAGCATF